MDTAVDIYKFLRVEIPTLEGEKAEFRKFIIGQEEALDPFATLLTRLRSGVRQKKPGPFDIKFLVGPSGVGKTEIVYALAEILAEGEDENPRKKVLKLNGGEFQEPHTISKLIGSPPGYLGFKEGASTTGTNPIFSQDNLDQYRIYYTDSKGQKKSIIFILVDEAEKASRAFHNLFLSILDRGDAVLSNNSKTDFSEAVIFYTSNVGNEIAERRHQEKITSSDVPAVFHQTLEGVVFNDEDKDLYDKEFARVFPPEFRGRIKEVIVFNHLTHEAVSQIAQNKVKDVEKTFADNEILVEIGLSAKALDWLTKMGYSHTEGARGMDKLIDKKIFEALIKLDANRGSTVLPDGIHRKRVYIDVNEYGDGLDFYFADGFQLEEPVVEIEFLANVPNNQSGVTEEVRHSKVPPPLNPEMRTALLNELKNEGLEGYIELRHKLAKQGIINRRSADYDPAISQMLESGLLDALKRFGFNSFMSYRDRCAQVGIWSVNDINNWERVLQEVRGILSEVRRLKGRQSYYNQRDVWVAAGVGNVTYWDSVTSN